MQRNGGADRRRRPLLLVLLAVLLLCLLGTVELARRTRAWDSLRPRSPLDSAARGGPPEPLGDTGEQVAPGPRPLDAEHPEEPEAVADAVARIEGFVYTPEGAPAAGAVVIARDRGVAASYRATAGDDGSFALDVPRARAYELLAMSPAGAPTLRFGVLPPCRVDVVLEPGGRIEGRAADRRTGAAVPGVVLVLSPGPQLSGGSLGQDILEGIEFSATADAEGGFVLDGISPGEWYMSVALGGRGSALTNLPGPVVVRCDVAVDRAAATTLLGRVCDDESGAPLEGAAVSVRGASARTDRGGVFRLEIAAGFTLLDVVAEGRPRVKKGVRVADARVPVEVRVPRYVSIGGRVLGPDDRPIPGARVRWIGRDGPSREQVAGEDGAFVIEGVAPDDPGVVQAEAKGFVTAEARPAGGVAVVRMEPGARIEGRVLGLDGGPLAGVPVVLLPGGWTAEEMEDDMDFAERRVARTDDQGRYAIEDVPAGGAWVFAVPGDPALAPAGVRAVAPGAAPDLALGRGRTVRGEVLDPEGRPLAGATVRVISELRGAEARTGPRGEFVLVALPAIDESIVVTLEGRAPARADLPGASSEPITVTMRPR